MKKVIGNIFLVVSATLLFWVAASWVDVLLHNSPWSGDFDYAAWNAFCLLAGK